ncbi:MAG: hypothetical protein M3256_28170, partial [Actinomycetota bacterium]|nr:hypothetical protein [Actinomycetota bacterium]
LTVSGAWACVPQPVLTVRPASSGFSGQQVTVDGIGFGSGPVEIRWNDVTGEELATASGPSFSAAVTVPMVPDGLYVLFGLSRSRDGGIDSLSRSEFLVSGGNVDPSGRLRTSGRTATVATGAGLLLYAGAVAAGAGLLGGLIAAHRCRLKCGESPPQDVLHHEMK